MQTYECLMEATWLPCIICSVSSRGSTIPRTARISGSISSQ